MVCQFEMTTTAMLIQFVSKYLDRLTNEINNSDAESLRQQIKHLSFMVSIGINRTFEDVELLIENQRTIMDDIDCGFITWKNLSYFNDWELKVLKMLNKVEKVEKEEDVENVKIEPDYEGYEDYAGWMDGDGGNIDHKSDPDFDGDDGDPVLISLVKKSKERAKEKAKEKAKGRYIKKAPGEPRKQRSQKSFVWNHFTVSSDPDDPNSGKHCLCRHCGKTMVMYDSGTTSHLKEHLLKHHNDEVDPEDKVEKRAVGSFVWNHFTKDKDTGKGVCQHCGMSVTIPNGGTTNLRTHIKKFHPEKYDETATTPYLRAAAEDQGEPQYIMDPESGEMVTEKEYKKKQKKKRKDKGQEKKKSSVVWNFFHRDPEDETKVICQICFKVLTYNHTNSTASMLGHLRYHKVLHEEEEEIPCSECGKLLPNKAALKRHEKRKHRDIDKFVCSYCPKAFCTNTRRLIHERIHTGEKPYQVPN